MPPTHRPRRPVHRDRVGAGSTMSLFSAAVSPLVDFERPSGAGAVPSPAPAAPPVVGSNASLFAGFKSEEELELGRLRARAAHDSDAALDELRLRHVDALAARAAGTAARVARTALGEAAARAKGAALLAACAEGRADDAMRLLAEGADPDRADADGWTSLMLASCRGGTLAPLAPRLVAAGAALDAVDAHGRASALMLASAHGTVVAARALIAAGADVDAHDAHGRSALSYANERGWLSVVELLMKSQTKH